MCQSINKMTENLNDIIRNGYSLGKMKYKFYNEIGKNVLYHRNCNYNYNCDFWLIIFEIENIYKILNNSEKCLELDLRLKESLESIIGKYNWQTRWDHIDDEYEIIK